VADLDWKPTESELVEYCRYWFDEPVEVRVLYGDTDQNTLVTRGDGQHSILKIRAEDGKAELDHIELQLAILGHLDGGADGIATPLPMSTRDGRPWRLLEGSEGRQHPAWMLSFVPGLLLDEIDRYSDALLRDIGRSIALVDRALMDFHDPRAQRDTEWDLKGVMQLQDCLGFVVDRERRSLLQVWYQRLAGEVMPALLDCPSSVIHNDGGNQHNMIVSGHDTVAGIIDFGDAVLTHRVCGLGIAAAYACFGTADPLRAMSLVAAGYHHQLALSADELSLLPGLVAARLVMSVSISSRRAASDADPYHSVSEENAWRVLADLSGESLAELSAKLESAFMSAIAEPS
jgi:Ser/Thr protein kinase RdoA (MazF antagonist)